MLSLKILNLSEAENAKKIIFPRILTSQLGEDIGWQIGDGCIAIRNSKSGPAYLYKLAGDPKEEKLFYDSIVVPTKIKLFNIYLGPRLIGDGSYGLCVASK
ncbi:MAG: hypothetical protein HY518_00435, partial [Candidatus Aenigmarchaeota archaeon]|nr:hypothetical protein [Candidatus Aenigmarchaeota archaeon]